MNAKGAEIQEKRIETFKRLSAVRSALASTIEKLHTKFGVHEQSAFTGNTRESRKIESLSIKFSFTQGGEVPVSLDLNYLQIPAGPLGDFLETQLRARLESIDKQMTAI